MKEKKIEFHFQKIQKENEMQKIEIKGIWGCLDIT